MHAESTARTRRRDTEMSEPFRIVYVSWEYPPQFGGGIGTYVHAMSRILAARGHQVTVVTVGGAAPAREVREGVAIIRLPTTPGGIGPLADLRLWQLRSLAVAELLRDLAHGGIDVIEFADYRGEGVEYLKRNRPDERPLCVLRLHAPLCVLNEFSPGLPRNALLEQYELEGVRLADRVVCPSQVLADHVRRHLDRPDLPVDLSPYPADPAFLAVDPSCIPAERDELLFVGRYQELKGAETLARAAAAFLTACPRARLTMIGGDTDRRPGESMKAIVRSLIPRGLWERVALLDRMPREQLIARYAAARVCVFPSHFENFPNTCLEAMSLGRPVIGTTQTGMQEIIEDRLSGFLVPPNDVEALASRLTRVWGMSDDDLRRVGEVARRRMVERYHPDVVAAEVEGLYRGYMKAGPLACARSAADAPEAVTSSAQFATLIAATELSFIENSRLWRVAQRVRRNRFFRFLSPEAKLSELPEPNDPAQRLAQLKSTPEYRFIQAMKRSAVYRWYARRKYGSDTIESGPAT
jgi:glycogen(starch) synthase